MCLKDENSPGICYHLIGPEMYYLETSRTTVCQTKAKHCHDLIKEYIRIFPLGLF